MTVNAITTPRTPSERRVASDRPSPRARACSALCAAGLTLVASTVARADDIAVFDVRTSKPQILLLLDYSESMKGMVGNTGKTRIEVLRESVVSILEANKDQAEFGIGSLFSQEPGGVHWPIGEPTADAHEIDDRIPPGTMTSLDVMKQMIQSAQIEFGTATVPALVEATNYFRGGPVRMGGADPDDTLSYAPYEWDAAAGAYAGFRLTGSNSASYTPRDAYRRGVAPGSTGFCTTGNQPGSGNASDDFCGNRPVRNCVAYTSTAGRPMERCEYTHDDAWDGANYQSPIENDCQANQILLVTDGLPFNVGGFDEIKDILGHPFDRCEDLSNNLFGPTYVSEQGNCAIELARHLAQTDQIPGMPGSRVSTNTIGFQINLTQGQDFLRRVADAGDGEYFDAGNPAELTTALQALVDNVVDESGQFENFTIDVDRASLSNGNRAYLPMFAPSGSKRWQGNLKGYFVGNDGLLDIDGNPASIIDNGRLRFLPTARSFWSANADGPDVLAGGSSSRLDPATRTLYTFSGNPASVHSGGVDLSAGTSHRLEASNNALEPLFGAAETERGALLDWIRQQPMGDPLHSNLVIGDYAGGRRVVFTMTNQGFLHAIDATEPRKTGQAGGGEEIFAFMPRELLANIRHQRDGTTPGEHLYGLDGAMTPWHTDTNGNGLVDAGEKMLLVFGMRRGGNRYYALDVSDPDRPRFAWQIDGGVGAFAELAQTWSRPALVRVRSGAGDKRVLVFSGGYDDAVDDVHAPTASGGNALFMVDERGRQIWKARHASMQYGIPSAPRVIDADGDGLADRLYVGDLGGQLWRVDFDDIERTGDFRTTLLAELSGGKHRPFFYPPSVSTSDRYGGLAVSIGSGNRDNPIADRTRGALFVIGDEVERLTTTPVPIEPGDLHDASTGPATAGANGADVGWVLELAEGEKVLSEVVVFENVLLATTYRSQTPAQIAAAAHQCGSATSTSRLYGLNVGDSSSAGLLSLDLPTRPGGYIDLASGGIPPKPQLVFSGDSGEAQLYVGNQKTLDLPLELRQQFWHAR